MQFHIKTVNLQQICIIMSINNIQDEIIEEFSIFDDWMDKYAYIIELGNKLQPIDERQKSEQNLIKGCQSRVWIDARYENGVVIFDAESDAVIVKGIVVLLLSVMNNQTPDSILSSELYFIDRIGLSQHLSPTRSNGLLSMIKQMRLYAMAFKAKYENN